mmetsp:Transcript_2781/g.7627  ORF Transcript_2781/g.7627 Transcript_2781/m.7627 type:complete len:448 (+) Transcript_2781:367-1710(+)
MVLTELHIAAVHNRPLALLDRLCHRLASLPKFALVEQLLGPREPLLDLVQNQSCCTGVVLAGERAHSFLTPLRATNLFVDLSESPSHVPPTRHSNLGKGGLAVTHEAFWDPAAPRGVPFGPKSLHQGARTDHGPHRLPPCSGVDVKAVSRKQSRTSLRVQAEQVRVRYRDLLPRPDVSNAHQGQLLARESLDTVGRARVVGDRGEGVDPKPHRFVVVVLNHQVVARHRREHGAQLLHARGGVLGQLQDLVGVGRGLGPRHFHRVRARLPVAVQLRHKSPLQGGPRFPSPVHSADEPQGGSHAEPRVELLALLLHHLRRDSALVPKVGLPRPGLGLPIQVLDDLGPGAPQELAPPRFERVVAVRPDLVRVQDGGVGHLPQHNSPLPHRPLRDQAPAPPGPHLHPEQRVGGLGQGLLDGLRSAGTLVHPRRRRSIRGGPLNARPGAPRP